MITIRKPEPIDLQSTRSILSQWTEKEEVDKYIERIGHEINGRSEYNMQFWVAKDDGKVVGVVGLSNPMPNILEFAKTKKPVEIKILYVDGKAQGKGVGKTIINFIEREAKGQSFKEVMVRSAKRYKFSAWGFYKKMEYQEVGGLPGENGKQTMQVFSKTL